MSPEELLKTDTVDWDLLANAAQYYSRLGYQEIDLPYLADHDYVMMTCPDEKYTLRTEKGTLVGSAEQSFFWYDMIGKLPKGKFFAITPCFRNEESFTRLHRLTFMKLELYVNDDVGETSLNRVIEDAYLFDKLFSKDFAGVDIVKTGDNECDIEVNGIEVGSYGIRIVNNTSWIYGTGLALPRFTQANSGASIGELVK